MYLYIDDSLQAYRFSLFKRKEATKNKVVIDVSDDEVMKDSDSVVSKGWNVKLTQNLSKCYCDNCGKEIAEGEKWCDFFFVMGSYDSELFGYNLNAPEFPIETGSNDGMVSPEQTKKYCAFCGNEIPLEDGEIPVENENCDECLFQTARERDFNTLGYVPCQYDKSYFDKEPLSSST